MTSSSMLPSGSLVALLDDFVHEPRIAYFSMEIALRNEIPTYSGGLGVLAGDTIRAAADMELPMVAVSLISHDGYFHQEIDADGRQPVILLDTDLEENHPDDRPITHFLYGNGEAYRLKQEMVLGIGGIRLLQNVIPVVYLPNYGMDTAQAMVAGVDTWINTPLPPREASGTSGMKAACNGVPNLSVLDGWWIEGCLEGITGWAVGGGPETDDGSDAASLYEKLEHTVLPLYHRDRAGWIAAMQGAIAKNASFLNSHRMMRRYATETYVRWEYPPRGRCAVAQQTAKSHGSASQTFEKPSSICHVLAT